MEFGCWVKASEQLPPRPEPYRSGHYLATVDNGQVDALLGIADIKDICDTCLNAAERTNWSHTIKGDIQSMRGGIDDEVQP